VPPAFSKKTIPEQFADKLMSDIVQGQFGPLLPSIRELAERYALNMVSVHKGVSFLVERGVLVNRGPRRRLVIASPQPSDKPCGCQQRGVPCCRPIIFLGADPSELNSTLMMATNDIQLASRANGGSCVTVILAGLSAKEKAATVRAAFLEHKPSHVLLLFCDPDVYDLVAKRSSKIAMLGGPAVGGKGEVLAANFALLAAAAFDDMLSLGHRKFRFMMLGRPASKADQTLMKAFSVEKGVDAGGVFGGKLDLPSMAKALQAALAAGVTAFAFPRPEDFVLAQAYFDTVGLNVPKDVSAVMLLSGPYDLMRAKQPAHFKITKEAIISLVLGWFEFDENRSQRITRESVGTYVRGKTVGPPKKTK